MLYDRLKVDHLKGTNLTFASKFVSNTLAVIFKSPFTHDL